KRLARTLVRHFNKVLLLLDSSFVQTHSKRKEKGSAYSGHKQKNGFKFHCLLDFFSRLPLGVEITHGAAHDTPIGENLIRGAPPSLPVCGVAADKGYDSEAFVFSIKQKWRRARIAIPVRNPHQSGDSTYNMTMKYKDRSRDRSLYK